MATEESDNCTAERAKEGGEKERDDEKKGDTHREEFPNRIVEPIWKQRSPEKLLLIGDLGLELRDDGRCAGHLQEAARRFGALEHLHLLCRAGMGHLRRSRAEAGVLILALASAEELALDVGAAVRIVAHAAHRNDDTLVHCRREERSEQRWRDVAGGGSGQRRLVDVPADGDRLLHIRRGELKALQLGAVASRACAGQHLGLARLDHRAADSARLGGGGLGRLARRRERPDGGTLCRRIRSRLGDCADHHQGGQHKQRAVEAGKHADAEARATLYLHTQARDPDSGSEIRQPPKQPRLYTRSSSEHGNRLNDTHERRRSSV